MVRLSSPDARARRAKVSPKDGVRRAKVEMYQRLILEAAERIFAERGFDVAKIQDIAHQAGLAPGTLYTVFPGKQEIYAAIQEQRGHEIFERIYEAIQGYESVGDACRRGIDAYVRSLVERPYFLRMHLREGTSWTSPSALRSGEEIANWQRGMTLAVSILGVGIERGFLVSGDSPEVLLKMLVAAHQVQLQDWLERGADPAEVDALIERMQSHFVRAFVRAEAGERSERSAAHGAR